MPASSSTTDQRLGNVTGERRDRLTVASRIGRWRQPGLRLALLGVPSAEVDGTPLAVDTRKAIALLAYLAVEGGTHNRDSLAALLWPEYDNDRARAALRRTLSTLRSALGRRLGRGRARRGQPRPRRRSGSTSTSSATRAMATRLAALERGGGALPRPLPGRLRPARQPGLRRLADVPARDAGARARRSCSTASPTLRGGRRRPGRRRIAHAQRRLALDPLHESAHRRLIELYARSGERSRRARAVPRLRPHPQPRARRRADRGDDGALPRDPRGARAPRGCPRSPTPAPRRRPARLPARRTRRSEWQALARASTRGPRPTAALVALEGESGHRQDAASRPSSPATCARDGGRVALACAASSTRPGSPTASVDRARARRPARRARPRSIRPPPPRPPGCCPSSAPPPPGSLDDPGAQARFFDGLTAVLAEALAGQRPGLDRRRRRPLGRQRLAGGPRLPHPPAAGRPLLVVLSWRPEETPPDHPRAGWSPRPATEGAGRALAPAPPRTRRGGRARRRRRRPGCARSRPCTPRRRGCPSSWSSTCSARNDDGRRAPAAGERARPAEARLAAASELATQVLAAAAVIGRALRASRRVREVSGRSDEETVAALEELARRGILAEDDQGTYDFRHEQAAQGRLRVDELGRRRLLHHRAADPRWPARRRPVAALAGAVAQHLLLGGRARSRRRPGSAPPASTRAACTRTPRRSRTSARRSALGDPDAGGARMAEIGDLQHARG